MAWRAQTGRSMMPKNLVKGAKAIERLCLRDLRHWHEFGTVRSLLRRGTALSRIFCAKEIAGFLALLHEIRHIVDFHGLPRAKLRRLPSQRSQLICLLRSGL